MCYKPVRSNTKQKCRSLCYPDSDEHGAADTDEEYELEDLVAWWAEYVASAAADEDGEA